MTNLEWIAKGNTGCTFATLFAKKPESVGWITMQHIDYEDSKYRIDLLTNRKVNLLSIEFPDDWNAKRVYNWTKKFRWFSTEDLGNECIGLRNVPPPDMRSMGCKESWVQYFGPDSHVITRQAPTPMLMYTRRLNPLGFVKQVGFNGILHLAHAFSQHITEKIADVLWNRAFVQTRKIIGHDLGLEEAAKTTWLLKDIE